MRQEQALRDLLVAQALGGECRDFPLLRRERVPGQPLGPRLRLPGGAEFAGGPVGPRRRAKAFEGLKRRGELGPGIGGAAIATQVLNQLG